jgi:serine/threonine-protein kinase HipA
MTRKLTVQINYNFAWHDVATMVFSEQLESSDCRLDYDFDHTINYFQQFADKAISVRLPNDTMPFRQSRWFRFLDDIMPAGSSRKYWIRKLRLGDESLMVRNFELLSKGTIAPIGNLRIKESVPDKLLNTVPVTFTLDDVCRLEVDFIEYAQQRGAAAGGASGAGGAAPKLLLRMKPDGGVWIDTFQDEHSNLDIHYLVKFPRGVQDIDKDILRAEYHFYHELASLGFDTIPIDSMRLEESDRGPSLWLPRFDTLVMNEQVQLLGMESVYSILDEGPGTPMHHGEVIRRLLDVFNGHEVYGSSTTFLDDVDGQAEFIIEWVRRDLLNIAFGNSDNHGRNTSFIKYDDRISLAPIYDFAPMKADPEIVTRTFTWGATLETGGEYRFADIADSLSDLVDPQRLLRELRKTAISLIDLRDRLAERGVPTTILNFPSMSYQNLAEKFTRWGLL